MNTINSDLELPSGKLGKTTRVLERSMRWSTYTHVGFVQREEDSQKLVTQVWFDAQSYEDMGCPDKVTVSIEPGDRLNA